jgi:hypothetical protein
MIFLQKESSAQAEVLESKWLCLLRYGDFSGRCNERINGFKLEKSQKSD